MRVFFFLPQEGDARLVRNSLGVHGGGHFTIAGDPGADSFISPGDPAFYLHHSQVDRVYWIWQMLDFANRQVRAVPACLKVVNCTLADGCTFTGRLRDKHVL